jgi:hypothetical protein
MSPLLRLTVLAGVSLAVVTGCTEVPSDIGVHKHRSATTRPRPRAVVHHPSVAYWNDDPSLKGGTKILINLTKQQAFFFRGKVIVGSTNISSGRRDYETPPGKYSVTQKDAHHVSSEYGQYVARSGAVLIHDADINRTRPPRGAHFVGAPMPYFMRFTGGYGMHAGFVPRFRASHGCIRMPTAMAKHFFDAAEIGTRVEVIEPPVMVGQ